MGKLPLAAVVGPTAAGKTDVAIELAKLLGGEIVSADSMLIYRGMDIGTAKPALAQRQGIPHHMIDVADIAEEYSAARYAEEAKMCIAGIHKRKKLPIVTGGTGLYINALTYPMDFGRTAGSAEFREKMHRLAQEKGQGALYALLCEKDPGTACRLHPNDMRRIVRALEIKELTGKSMSEIKTDYKERESGYDLAMLGITLERAKLYERIDRRVEMMLEGGLLNEVRGILEKGYDESHTSLQGLGYKELIMYLRGMLTFEDAVERIKRSTRRFAKRQLTWFRRDERIRWYDRADYGSAKDLAQAMAQEIRRAIL